MAGRRAETLRVKHPDGIGGGSLSAQRPVLRSGGGTGQVQAAGLRAAHGSLALQPVAETNVATPHRMERGGSSGDGDGAWAEGPAGSSLRPQCTHPVSAGELVRNRGVRRGTG